jgi:hypothetical protein
MSNDLREKLVRIEMEIASIEFQLAEHVAHPRHSGDWEIRARHALGQFKAKQSAALAALSKLGMLADLSCSQKD